MVVGGRGRDGDGLGSGVKGYELWEEHRKR